MILEYVQDCRGLGWACDEWLEVGPGEEETQCDRPAVLAIDFSGGGDVTKLTYCVRHARELAGRIAAVIAATEEA